MTLDVDVLLLILVAAAATSIALVAFCPRIERAIRTWRCELCSDRRRREARAFAASLEGQRWQ